MKQSFQQRTTSCRECNGLVSYTATMCPHCGAPKPSDLTWDGGGYEYKTTTQIAGLPLIHIAFGRDKHNKLRVAKGFIAIGQYARGIIVIAQFGMGIIHLTQFGIGAIGVSQFNVSLFAIGQFTIALAGIAQLGMMVWWGKGQFIITLSELLQGIF